MTISVSQNQPEMAEGRVCIHIKKSETKRGIEVRGWRAGDKTQVFPPERLSVLELEMGTSALEELYASIGKFLGTSFARDK